LVYRIAGVRVPVRTNRFDLPTEHFATPVGRVRLVAVDEGAELIIELRMPARSQARLQRTPRGTVLNVDFREPARLPATETETGEAATPAQGEPAGP
jgi:hypothetical protein